MPEPLEDSLNTQAPRIEELSATLLADRKRVRVTLRLNDPTSKPTIEFRLLDALQEVIMESIIIGVFEESVTFTLHLMNHTPDGDLFVSGTVLLNETEVQDSRQVLVGVEF